MARPLKADHGIMPWHFQQGLGLASSRCYYHGPRLVLQYLLSNARKPVSLHIQPHLTYPVILEVLNSIHPDLHSRRRTSS